MAKHKQEHKKTRRNRKRKNKTKKQTAGRDFSERVNLFRLLMNTEKEKGEYYDEEERELFKDVEPSPIQFYRVFGANCESKLKYQLQSNMKGPAAYEESKLKKMKLDYAKKLNLPEENIHITCTSNFHVYMNAALIRIKQNIPLLNYFSTLPIENDPEFIALVKNIKEDLNNNKKVYLSGESWGGAMCNRVAMILQKELPTISNIHNLEINAYGSIFVASFEDTKDIKLTNYMGIQDFALLYNGLQYPDPLDLPKKSDVVDIKEGSNFRNLYPNYPNKAYYTFREKPMDDTVVWVDFWIEVPDETPFVNVRNYYYDMGIGKHVPATIHNAYEPVEFDVLARINPAVKKKKKWFSR
jgi:hypothetical protein